MLSVYKVYGNSSNSTYATQIAMTRIGDVYIRYSDANSAWSSWTQLKFTDTTAWSSITGKPSTFTPATHTHTKSQITDFPASLKNPEAITIKLNGGATEGANLFTYDGSAAKTVNIVHAAIGAAATSHGTHVSYSTATPKANGTASAGTTTTVSRSDHVHPLQTTVSGNAGSATKVNNNLIIKLNSGATEGTNLFTFNGSAAKTVNITPSSIGAAASSHSHSYIPTANGEAQNLSTYGLTVKSTTDEGGQIDLLPADDNSTASGISIDTCLNGEFRVFNIPNSTTGAGIGTVFQIHPQTATFGEDYSFSGTCPKYLPLSGGTMTGGQIIRPGQSSSFYNGRDVALIRNSTCPTDCYTPIFSVKSWTGSWELGPYSTSSLYLTHMSDTNYTNKVNESTAQYRFGADGQFNAKTLSESNTLLSNKYAAKTHTHNTLVSSDTTLTLNSSDLSTNIDDDFTLGWGGLRLYGIYSRRNKLSSIYSQYLAQGKIELINSVGSSSGTSYSSTSAANVRIETSGTYQYYMVRTSSSSKYKVDIKPLEQPDDYAYRILTLEPKQWYNKGQVEAYADHLTRVYNEEEETETEANADYELTTVYGLIAEDVEAAGLDKYCEYLTNEDGTQSLEGIQYDRLLTLLIPICRDLNNEVKELRKEIEEIKANMNASTV